MWVGDLLDLNGEGYIRQVDVEANLFELTREGYFDATRINGEEEGS